MRPPPPPAELLKYPVTVIVATLAVAVTVSWHSGGDISNLVMDFRAWDGQPWRLLTSAFPHVDIFHLLFNLYWLWVFGSAVEAAYGQLPTAAIYVFFAAGSAAAEYAFLSGGVGLSGIGYGLFGMLWVLSCKDDRFLDVVDARTVGLFVIWFFLCIALTATEVWRVGNVAHGMGAVQGILLGFALTTQRRKHLVIACLTGLMLAVVAAATVGRPFVNLSRHAGEDLAYAGYLELQEGSAERAAALLERAVRLNDRQAGWWYNLGIANGRLGRAIEATEAFRHAVNLDPAVTRYRSALTEWLAAVAYQKQIAGEDDAAAELYRESLDVDDRDAKIWFNLGIAYAKLGRRQDAKLAYQKAAALAPDDEQIRAALEALRAAERQP